MERLKLSSEALFSNMMRLTALYAPQCSLPYEYLKISASGAEWSKSQDPVEAKMEQTTIALQSETDSSVQ